VHAPGRFTPHRIAESASLLDILPTLAEIAHDGDTPGYATPLGGRSLLPALRGGPGPGEVIGEYLAEGAVAPIVMIRRGRYKFIHSPADPDQLYDVASDPDERNNLAASQAEASRVAAFRAEVARRWQLGAVQDAVLASQRQRHFVYPALRKGRFQAWDHQPIRDATRAYIRNDQELNDLEAMARFPRLS
jgi:choline-sulfatase